MTPEDPISCPKCGATSGDNWSQCGDSCPMPISPVYSAALETLFNAEMPTEPDPSWPHDMQPTGRAYLAWRPVDYEDATIDEPIAIAQQMAGARGVLGNREFLQEHHLKSHTITIHSTPDAVALMKQFEQDSRQSKQNRRKAAPF